MSIVLGIDPGSRKTGYGLVNIVSGRYEYVSSGVIRIDGALALPARLKEIYDAVSVIIGEYLPHEFAIEQVFMAKSAGSALKLGQARGAAIVAAVGKDLPVFEYEARKVKQSVVGSGAAEKCQVQHMVKTLLKLPSSPQEDAADALAVALCHANTQQHVIRTAGSRRYRRGRIV